ncbi:subtilisin peptidase [Trypanosoma cruzi]|uniref:Subtilisin-like serine peptidase, putative n=2 Tax=Trypanosoma cruzi TaxID=5693 RepID=Q4CW68_TRYCC|nr:subtilisin-like serine peptidase, putative [Trypanosoma cruzi]EAN84521.1 subtilisin-like serine peptidase, putative [Trypanosoma cruzi]PWV14287.1 subtilisin peptidase [Trypanosoma cruzi]|eukprot:XP_806372.1 subtilisin-like serine peptidase [Trypanosoma cruzi strain CL Brener]
MPFPFFLLFLNEADQKKKEEGKGMRCRQIGSTFTKHFHHLAGNSFCVFLLLLLSQTLLVRGGVQSPVPCDSGFGRDYIVFINTYLLPDGTINVAKETQRWWKWRQADKTCGCLSIAPHVSKGGGWQDFVVVRVLSPQRNRSMRCVQTELRDVRLVFPCVGQISVLRVVENTFLWGNRTLASVAQQTGFATARPLYPRRYFGLSSTLKWTGRGVRIALLDTGLDSHLLLSESSSLEQQRDSNGTGGTRKPLLMCTSFVPGFSCENNQDGHGTFSVSLMAGNISLLEWNRNKSVLEAKHMRSDDKFIAEKTGLLSARSQYLGMAPGADVHMLRVFDDNRDTRTAWCIAALNFALQWGANIINLSFGGIDYYDAVFTEKITELATKGVVVVAATGNEGPRMGSVHNPADQNEVISVGSLGTRGRRLISRRDYYYDDDNTEMNKSSIRLPVRWVSTFSGRGPSTWEMPYGTGRPRPDLVALGEHVLGVGRDEGSGTLSLRVSHGTSVAAPIVAGIVALCIDALQRLHGNWKANMNVAVIKRVLMETAVEIHPRLSALRVMEAALHKEEKELLAQRKCDWWRRGRNAFHRRDGIAITRTLFHYRNVLQYSRMSQGAGEVCPMCALSWIAEEGQNRKLLSGFAFPREIEATGEHQLPYGEASPTSLPPCLLNWPYCEQPLFPSATPVEYNINIYYPQCPAARLAQATPWIRMTSARGICSAHRREQCQASIVDLTTAKQLLFLRAHAPQTLEAYSGVISLFALSPSNASNVRLTSSATEILEADDRERVLGHFDLIEVSGNVNVVYSCNASFHGILRGTKEDETRFASEWVTIPFRISIVPRPSRAQRMAFDINHQWFYPPDFIPGDDSRPEPMHNKEHQHMKRRALRESHGVFECDSDHPHTNMAPLLLYLRREMKLFVELPLLSYLSFWLHRNETVPTPSLHWRNASRSYYSSIGTLLLLDPELPLLKEERAVFVDAVLLYQLNVVIISEWYSEQVARGLSFYDFTRNRTWSPLFLTKRGEMVESTIVDEDNERNSHGLKGACHVPSLNKFLCEISEGLLQLDEERVVDGELVLATSSSFFRHHTGWGEQTVYRHFARMISAGMLRWPPAGSGCFARAPPCGEIARTTMVCGMERAWANELHEFTKSEGRTRGDEASNEAADVWRQVDPGGFIPLFGFVGVGNSDTDEECGRSSADGMKRCGRGRGRVAVFTDTSGFGSSSASLQASLRVLDKLFYDVSSQLSGNTGVEVVVPPRVREAIKNLVTHESEAPSFTFSIIRDFFHFVYTGDVPEFTNGAECKRSNGHMHAVTTPVEVNVREYEENEYEELLSALFASAPRRVAVARRLREVFSGWETAVTVADDDCIFRNNEFHFKEKNSHEAAMGLVLFVCLSLVVLGLTFILLWKRKRVHCAFRGILKSDKGYSKRKKEEKKGK